jgi:hypothetical protein
MTLRFGSLALGSVAALSALLLASNDARACGGCFHPEDQPETTLVTGHRMAFAISKTQTVLWDQIQYSGAPSEFAWVLPVKPGAYIEVSNDAWFDSLDAATSTRVVAPQIICVQPSFPEDDVGTRSGCGCGSIGADDASAGVAFPTPAGPADKGPIVPPVSVTHEGSVGPYDTVTLHANVPGEGVSTWLSDNNFAIDESVKPIIDAYTAENFDFIAVRLRPGQGIQQMQPVRVVSPGASPALPLRMVAAGTGANVDLTLFVIGEGRWEIENFPNHIIDPLGLSWDFAKDASNYATLRQQTLAKEGGRTWLNTYAKQGALLSPVTNPTTLGLVQYGDSGASTIGNLYVDQAKINDQLVDTACTKAFNQYAQSGGVVVDLCSSAGNDSCGTLQIGQIDSRELACGKFDDLAVALIGSRPRDVWLTRLEANLPHDALKEDLKIQAAAVQQGVENWLTAVTPVNPPCQLAAAPVDPASRFEGSGPGNTRGRTDLVLLGAALAALGAALARRTRRPLAVAIAQPR